MKILLIEDEKELARALRKGLELNGYQCEIAYDGEDGLNKYFDNIYEVIILDLNLPILDGLEVLKEIRREDSLQKVIILSARSEISDKVLGFDLGTNDYLAKPFDFLELLARINSLARRTIIQNNSVIELGNLKVDTNTKKAFIKETILKLSSKEYRILEYLILNKDKASSAEKILEHVWENEVDFLTDTIKVHISNIRKKLLASSNISIISIRGEGYILEEIK